MFAEIYEARASEEKAKSCLLLTIWQRNGYAGVTLSMKADLREHRSEMQAQRDETR